MYYTVGVERMRLRIGLVLATIAIVAVLFALPASWYHIHVVGPNFLVAMEVNEDPMDQEIRELEGEWNLGNYQISNSTWRAPPELYSDPLTVVPMYEETDEPVPNANAQAVIENTTVAIVAAVFILGLAVFGAWNIARHDRYRMFTAASFLLAGVLLIGACMYMGTEMPSALAADSASGHEDNFGIAFEAYIDPEGGEAGFYNEFSGGYPDNNPRNAEQLDYGPGAGWWLAGFSGVLALITAGLFVGAPNWQPLKKESTAPIEVVRYVPVPTVTSLRQRRRYPRRMPAVSRDMTRNLK